jgi:hypothetical protein
MILDAMETCDIDFFKAALDECQRTSIPDTDPDVKGARNRFEFLSCKTGFLLLVFIICYFVLFLIKAISRHFIPQKEDIFFL